MKAAALCAGLYEIFFGKGAYLGYFFEKGAYLRYYSVHVCDANLGIVPGAMKVLRQLQH